MRSNCLRPVLATTICTKLNASRLAMLSVGLLGALSSFQLLAAEPRLPFKYEGAEPSTPVAQITIYLLAVALILFFALLFLKRRRNVSNNKPWGGWLGAAADSDAIKVLSSKRVTATTSLHVVEWEGGKFLLAINGNQTVRLDNVTPASSGSHLVTPQGSKV